MTRLGRLPSSSRQGAEAVWVVGTFIVTVMLVGSMAIIGSRPPSSLSPSPAPVTVPPGTRGGAEMQAHIDALTKRAESAEVEAKDAEQQESQEETKLKSTQADLDAAVKARKELEDEIKSLADTNSSSSKHDPAATLKKMQAELADTRVKLTDAKAAVESETAEKKALASQLKKSQDQAADLETQLKKAQDALAAAQSSAPQSPGPAVSGGNGWLQALTRSGFISFLLGVAGACGILGPSSYVQYYLPVTGSLFGGLLCAGFFARSADDSLLDSMHLILTGSCSWSVEFLWLSLLALGVARWYANVDCSLWQTVDELKVPTPANKNPGAAPLLG